MERSKAAPAPIVEEVIIPKTGPTLLDALEALAPGTELKKAAHGWDVHVATPGTAHRAHGSGPTLVAAFASIGQRLEPMLKPYVAPPDPDN